MLCLTAVLPLPSLEKTDALADVRVLSFDPCRALELEGLREALPKGNPDFDARFKLCAYHYYQILKSGTWGFPWEHFKRAWDRFFLELLALSEQDKELFLNAKPERYFPLQSEPDTKAAEKSGFFNYRHVMPFEKLPWAWYEPHAMTAEEFDCLLLKTLRKLLEAIPGSEDKIPVLIHSVGDTYEEGIMERLLRECRIQECRVSESAVGLYLRYINSSAAIASWSYSHEKSLETAFDAALARCKVSRFKGKTQETVNPQSELQHTGMKLPASLLNALRKVLPQESVILDFEREYLHPEYLKALKGRYVREFAPFNH